MLMTREQGFYKRVLMLVAPLALQNVIAFSVSLADNLMVGSLGELALSGVAVAIQLQTFLHMLVVGLSAAMMILASQYWGKRDQDSVRIIVSFTLKMALATGSLLLLATLLFPGQVLQLFTNDPAVIRESMKYLTVIRFTYIFFCLTQVLITSMRCVETVRIGMYVSMITFVVNVFLNWILIFGNLGAPALGIRGAAIATLTARILETAVMVVYVGFIDKKLQFRLRDLLANDKVLLRKYFKYGFPVILGDICWGINLSVQGAIIGRLGETTIAAVSIANIIFSIFGIAAYGAAGAAAIIIGQAVGAGDNNKVREYARTLQVLFICIGVVSGLALFFAKDHIGLIYRNLEPDTMSLTIGLLTVLSVTIVGTAYQMASLTGIVRAGGATHFVLINDLIFVWCVVLPSAYIAAFVLEASPVVVFACLKCDQILKCFVAIIKVNRFRWIKNLTKQVPAAADKREKPDQVPA